MAIAMNKNEQPQTSGGIANRPHSTAPNAWSWCVPSVVDSTRRLRAPEPRPGGYGAGMELSDGVEMFDVDHEDHDLTRASLVGAELTDVRFQRVRLAAARLEAARLTRVVFRDCDLSGVDCSEATMSSCRFEDCRLTGAELAQVCVRDTAFVRSRLDDANLRLSHVDRSRFEECVLVSADLVGAELRDVVLVACDCTGADFTDARCDRVDLRGARLDGIRGVGALRNATVAPEHLVVLAPALASACGIRVLPEGAAGDDAGGRARTGRGARRRSPPGR